jgi:eukaryotic-like serine/threonine-protein kinase
MPGPADTAITAAQLAADTEATLPTGLVGDPLPAAPVDEPAIGSQVGPWLLRRLLGRGGMGAVFLAERAEHDFQQRAALKLIKLGMDSAEIERRFVGERRILARLEHPNIARLIDGGLDQRGRPYFVMEWVDGLPLIDYAKAHDLDVATRLRVFLKLCDAVAHAHRQLVVHRDLKPGNILVDTRGEPKLLDFGIAKVLENDQEDDTSATGPRFYTRAYAAPEQVRGEPVTTATDIYALGAVLFELLTGVAMHRARSLVQETRELLAQARRQAGEDGPSTITPRMLAGDLALVVSKSVRDEPTRRYASVEAFSEDIRAFLAGRPVRARPDSFGYRSLRFLRRHWLGVLASTAVLLAVLGGTTVALWQARVAQGEALRAEAVSAFLSSVFESATPEGAAGGDITARSLLERGGERIERELAGQPAVRARLYASLGNAWFYIGDSARAAAMFESGRALVDNDDWRTQTALLRGLARAELAAGKVDQARTHVDQALALLARVAPDALLERTLVESVSKSVYGAEGATSRALELARSVHAALVGLLGEHAEGTLLALNDLGTWTMESGDAQTALSLFDQVIAERHQVSAPDHPEIATAMHNRQLALVRLGRIDEALIAAREVVAMRRRILPPLHRDLARSLGALANIQTRQGDIDTAVRTRSEAIALLRAQRQPDQILLAQELTNQGTDAFRLEDLAGARRDLDEALTLLLPQLGPLDTRVLTAQSYLGLVQTHLGELGAAEQTLRAVSAAEARQPNVGLAQKLATRRYLARALRWQGNPQEARAVLAEAQSWLTEPVAISANSRARTHVEMALTMIDLARWPEAQAQITQAIDAYGGIAGAGASDQAQILNAQARLALGQSQWPQARAFAEAALDLVSEPSLGGQSELAEVQALRQLASWRAHPGAAERQALTAALEWHERHRPWHPDTSILRDALALTGQPAPHRR